MPESSSKSFHLLDERIQRFIWAEGWESPRDAQEAAIVQSHGVEIRVECYALQDLAEPLAGFRPVIGFFGSLHASGSQLQRFNVA
jgi:hypothetical protein